MTLFGGNFQAYSTQQDVQSQQARVCHTSYLAFIKVNVGLGLCKRWFLCNLIKVQNMLMPLGKQFFDVSINRYYNLKMIIWNDPIIETVNSTFRVVLKMNTFGQVVFISGKEKAGRWYVNWRLFYIVCSETFAYNEGNEWMVSHYLFKKQKNYQVHFYDTYQ